MYEHLPDLLKSRLERPLPGADAQYRLAPFHRKPEELNVFDPAGYRPSAVMVLLCRRNEGRWMIPLTLRSEYQGAHSAQVSLPGGKFDEEDGDLVNTALRECGEEIGLTENISVIGKLSPLHIPVSRFMVQPIVGVLQANDWIYRSHEREVKAIIELSVDALLDDGILVRGEVDAPGRGRIPAPYFFYEHQKIWGATAMILSELKQLMKEALQVTASGPASRS